MLAAANPERAHGDERCGQTGRCEEAVAGRTARAKETRACNFVCEMWPEDQTVSDDGTQKDRDLPASTQHVDVERSGLAAAEELVLLAARAVGALDAANQEYSNAHGHQDGQHIRVSREPMDNAMHKPANLFAFQNADFTGCIVRCIDPGIPFSGSEKCTILSPPPAVFFRLTKENKKRN